MSLRLNEHRIVLIVVDLALVNLTTLLALWIMAARAGWAFSRPYLVDQSAWFPFLSALWLLSAFLNGFYDPRKMASRLESIKALSRTVLLITLAYFGVYFFSEPGSLPRGVVGYQGASSFFLIGLWHVLYVSLLQSPVSSRKALIVGAGAAGRAIAQAIHQYARVHYQLLGFVDDDWSKQGMTLRFVAGEWQMVHRGDVSGPRGDRCELQLPILAGSCDMLRIVQEQHVPELILAVSQNVSPPLFDALLECKAQGAQITLMPILFEQLTGQIPIEHIGDNWNIALPLDSAEAGGLYPVAKRLFDVVGALIGLTLFSVLFPAIAIAIRLDSPGSIFYSQRRVGKGGRAFDLLKLRTMVTSAEEDGRARRAQAHDPRVTRVGRWLRKMRLDEMPQLINVLRGEMSAVGPRPERPEHLVEFDRDIPFHRLRNAVKPGMAGWAVVNYDYVETLADARIRLQYDLYYIKHQSFWLDLVILLRTMGHMLMLRGR